MKPLVTKAQGIACRKAAEYIAEGKWDGVAIAGLGSGGLAFSAYRSIGGRSNYGGYNQHQVLTALLWCAEIAGEA